MPRVFSGAVLAIAVLVLTGWSWAQDPSQSATRPGANSTSPADSSMRSSQTTLPKDIDPASRARLPNVKREDLDEDGKKTYDLIVNQTTPYSRGLPTPIGMWMHSPKMAQYILPAYMYLRFGTRFGTRLTELAILVTAREINSQFQWTSHEPTALKIGLEPEIIDVVKYRRSLPGLGEKEAVIIAFGRELFGNRKVTSETFAHALKLFGREGVTDLAALMAFYQFLYYSSNVAFDIQMPPDWHPLLPALPSDNSHTGNANSPATDTARPLGNSTGASRSAAAGITQ